MGSVQKNGAERETFLALCQERFSMGKALGIDLPEELVELNLMVLDGMWADNTASMQKDLAKGKESEIDGLLFEMVRMGDKWRVHIPTYRNIAQRFQRNY